MIEVTIAGIDNSPVNYQRVVLLKEKTSERYLPIWIGPTEADAIAVKLLNVDVPRPLSHDLLCSVIGSLEASIDSIIIDELREDTFHGKVILNTAGGRLEIDSRPSDALALAVRARAPIFAEEAVMDKASVQVDMETGEPIPQEALAGTNVSEDELKKLSAYKDFINSLDMSDLGKE